MHFQAEIERLIANARRLGSPALATAVALDLRAPQPDHEWHAGCCHCIEQKEKQLGDVAAEFRLSFDISQSAGDCPSCSYSGPDVIVACLPL